MSPLVLSYWPALPMLFYDRNDLDFMASSRARDPNEPLPKSLQPDRGAPLPF